MRASFFPLSPIWTMIAVLGQFTEPLFDRNSETHQNCPYSNDDITRTASPLLSKPTRHQKWTSFVLSEFLPEFWGTVATTTNFGIGGIAMLHAHHFRADVIIHRTSLHHSGRARFERGWALGYHRISNTDARGRPYGPHSTRHNTPASNQLTSSPLPCTCTSSRIWKIISRIRNGDATARGRKFGR